MTQENLENTVIKLFLEYGDETSNLLLKQLEHLEVEKRDFTGIGFYTYFRSPDSLRVENVSKVYDDLHVDIRNPDDNIHFMLYVDSGKISCLKASTFMGWQEGDSMRIDPNSFYGGGQSPFLGG